MSAPKKFSHVPHWIPLGIVLSLSLLAGMLNAGDLVVKNGGLLTVRSRVELQSGSVTVQSGGKLNLVPPGTVDSSNITVLSGGTVTGSGTLDGALVNSGTITSNSGPTNSFVITGAVTNHGVIRVVAGTGLEGQSSFVNNGLLDLTTAGVSVFFSLTNNGTILQGIVDVPYLSLLSPDVVVTLRSAPGKSYRLERSPSMMVGTWTPIGAAQNGTGGQLVFVHSGGSTPGFGFYRFQVTP